MNSNNFRLEIRDKKRFEFGKNWEKFINKIDDKRINTSMASLKKMLYLKNLKNKNFIDVGSGSGLFSLAARNLGAFVTSFDYDDNCVHCTQLLKSRFFKNDINWKIKQGSILDNKFTKSLGQYDIVYSWGVLHHTGKMWIAIDNCMRLVNKNGKLFIAIYNDQGLKSHIWWIIKWFYNFLPKFLKKPFVFTASFFVNFLVILKYSIKLKPKIIFNNVIKQRRGMSMLTNIIDWYGGYPYEFADYEYLINYIQNNRFKLINGKKNTSSGCHELVFKKI